MSSALEVTNLHTSFFTHVGEVKAVRGVNFSLKEGEIVGIVGESGCGKSVTMNSIMGIIPDSAKVVDGSVVYKGTELIGLSEKAMRKIRGNEIAMIFQDPMTSLNPVLTIGNQLTEHLILHKKLSKSKANQRAIEMLTLVGIPNPKERMKNYPHEFSGGMRQRVVIAMALVTEPKILIADEPTTALDVTIQAQILELIRKINKELKMTIVLITHDLGVVAEMCERVLVMYGGKLIEEGPVEEIFYNPKHPYTVGLLRSVPNPNSNTRERLIPIEGQPPDLLNPPLGCPFVDRCEYAMKVCVENYPESYQIKDEHLVSCWLEHPDAPPVELKV